MDFSAVGKKIKELRKQFGLSQGELASGICSQAQISKIEKGEVYPFASTLYLISQRLGVDVNYFFDIGMTPRLDYVQEVERQLKAARYTMNYEEMQQIVQSEEKNPLFLNNTKNQQLLLWHKGIYEYVINKKFEKALAILREALMLTQSTEKFHTEREIELMLTIGVFYYEEYDYENALATYQAANKCLKTLPYVVDAAIQTRLFYNIARALTKLKRFEESITYCEQGINCCIENQSLYVFGELHYQKGYNYELHGDIGNAIDFIKKASLIFNLQKDTRYATIIAEKLGNLTKEP